MKNFFEIVSIFLLSIKKFTDLQDLNFLMKNILKISNEESIEIVRQSIPEKNPILYTETSLKILY